MSQKISLNYCCAYCFELCPQKLCSRCKQTWYCCKEHQKSDFPLHKEFCKATEAFSKEDVEHLIKNAKAITNPRISDEQIKFLEETEVTIEWFENFLKRKLTENERQKILYREVCKTCYRSSLTCELTPCPECFQVSFCSKHMMNYKFHKNECKEFQLFQKGCTLKALGEVEKIPMLHQTNFVSLEKFSSISKYLEFITKKTQPETPLCSDNLTWPLTLGYCIEKCKKVTNKELIIHLIGAEDELDNIGYYEEILHWFPKVESVKITLFGPNLKSENSGWTSLKLCPQCEKKNYKFSFCCRKELYHDREITIEQTPHIIFGFHPGLHLYNSFEITLKNISSTKTSCFFTSWIKSEAKIYVEILQEFKQNHSKIEILSNPFKSPFGFLNPKDHDMLYYDNNYIIHFQ